ncbi:MAG: SRPBCC family protein [Litoreibacter sp.]|nr:SRPBCC family protein [Litoreibacter sp.]
MKFTTREDLEAPIERVFGMLSDFEAFERAALRRGAEVTRAFEGEKLEIGCTWNARATIRGKPRVLKVELSQYDPPTTMKFSIDSDGFEAEFLVDLVALSRNRTRLQVELDIRPRSLPARLLMQSAKLARNSLNRRYKTRVRGFAQDLEQRYKRAEHA